jgi:hypothetical protein
VAVAEQRLVAAFYLSRAVRRDDLPELARRAGVEVVRSVMCLPPRQPSRKRSMAWAVRTQEWVTGRTGG